MGDIMDKEHENVLRSRFYDLTDRIHYISESSPELIVKLLTDLAVKINYSKDDDFITDVNYLEVTDDINSWIKEIETYKKLPIN
jgi:hypothetical protein